jgi:predicted metalloprotease with PDZ domain
MKTFIATLTLMIISMTALSQTPTIAYQLAMPKPSTHLFEVQVKLDNLPTADASIDMVMPVWRPGRYIVFDFAGGVQGFSATDENEKSLQWEKADKSTYRISKKGKRTIIVQYKVYANEFHLRTRGLNDKHGFVDGTAVFMFVEKYRKLPVTLKVNPYEDWHITTGLQEADTNKFTAPNYDDFVDCPLEIGTHRDIEFIIAGKKHMFCVPSEISVDEAKLKDEVSRIVNVHIELFGSLPYEKYCFIVHTSPNSGGGTEHMNSMVIGIRPNQFKSSVGFYSFIGLIQHEFFHTWNVKQFRPKAFSPYDYTKENYSNEIWIAEGLTSYYGPFMMKRAGFLTLEQVLADIANDVRTDRMRPGNRVQSVTEASFDTWIKYSKQGQNAYNAETEIYGKGSNIGLLLDLELRNRSGGERSLDDAIRLMMKIYPRNSGGYTVDDFQKVCEEVAGSTLKDFFNDYVYGVKPLDWERALLCAGLRLETQGELRPWLGVGTAEVEGRARVTMVVANSPAYDAGLDVGDEIIAVNNTKIRPSELAETIASMKEGDSVAVTFFQDDKLRTVEVVLKNQSTPSYQIVKISEPSELQKKIYEGWLREKW